MLKLPSVKPNPIKRVLGKKEKKTIRAGRGGKNAPEQDDPQQRFKNGQIRIPKNGEDEGLSGRALTQNGEKTKGRKPPKEFGGFLTGGRKRMGGRGGKQGSREKARTRTEER